jgi:hypothetical protein
MRDQAAMSDVRAGGAVRRLRAELVCGLRSGPLHDWSSYWSNVLMVQAYQAASLAVSVRFAPKCMTGRLHVVARP